VVADSSKWGVVSNYEIASLSRVQILVSDAGLPDLAVDRLSAGGVRVIRAAPDLDPEAARDDLRHTTGRDPNGHR
jgi:hypothetical protein